MRAVIRLNENKSAFLHWDYIVDVYEGENLVARSYADSVLIASRIAGSLAGTADSVTVEV